MRSLVSSNLYTTILVAEITALSSHAISLAEISRQLWSPVLILLDFVVDFLTAA